MDSENDARLRWVHPENIPTFWPDIEPFIEAACRKGPCCSVTADNLREACIRGEHQLWMIRKGYSTVGSVITGVLSTPYGNALEIIALGGDGLNDWIHLERELAARAKEDMGVIVMQTFCRPGIMRRLNPMGYRIRGYIMERSL